MFGTTLWFIGESTILKQFLCHSYSYLRGVLGKFSLQGPAMQAQEFGRLGDVAAAIRQHALDVLPFHSRQAWNHVGRRSVVL